eukprot:11259782-Ditylum_brightwellii.AAC.2
MVTFSKPLTTNTPQGNGPQELKPIIPIEHPQVQGLTKGNHHMYKLHMIPYNANSPTYNLAVPFYDTISVEEWLKFQQKLQDIITGQNVINSQGMYAVTKSMLCRDALTTFANAKGVNRSQLELNYKQTMKDVYMRMFPLQEYVIWMRYMCQTLAKPYGISLHTFVAHINEMNGQLEQFLPRDNRTPQVKLAEDKLMDILENTVPKSWQGEMCRQ